MTDTLCTDEAALAAARLRASRMREELRRTLDRARRIQEGARDYLAAAERTARSRGEDPDSHDGRVGAYPRLALWLCDEAFRHLQRRPACAQSYLAWALAYLEVAMADLDGVAGVGLATEHHKASGWLDGMLASASHPGGNTDA